MPTNLDRVELVRALVERWNAGDHGVDALGDFFDPAVEVENALASVRGAPYRGHAGIERWVTDLDEQFTTWSIRLHKVCEVGGRVLTTGTVDAQGRASGVALKFPSWSVFEFGSDQRIIRIRIYPDVSEARIAVGLE